MPSSISVLIGLALSVGQHVHARDVVLHVAPVRASALEMARTKRDHRALAKLHSDAVVVTVDPRLSFETSAASLDADRAMMRDALDRALALHRGPIRAIVFQTIAGLTDHGFMIHPFGLVTTGGPSAEFAAAASIGRAREDAAIVLLTDESFNGRLSEVQELARQIMLAFGIVRGSVYGLTNEGKWPVTAVPGLGWHTRDSTRRDRINTGRFFDFEDGVGRSRLLRLGLDDRAIFGCERALTRVRADANPTRY